ncbi:MAG: hypothetical protein ABFD92_09835 [Planctomycetaceae bacterium]|nr:hypothetical protein [Planctomycetaceae bacterium]
MMAILAQEGMVYPWILLAVPAWVLAGLLSLVALVVSILNRPRAGIALGLAAIGLMIIVEISRLPGHHYSLHKLWFYNPEAWPILLILYSPAILGILGLVVSLLRKKKRAAGCKTRDNSL